MWNVLQNLPAEPQVGRTPKGGYSPRVRYRHLLAVETPFSEPLLRTLLRTLFSCKTHSRRPSQNPSEKPSPPEPCPEPSQNPSWNAVLPYDPFGVHPTKGSAEFWTNLWEPRPFFWGPAFVVPSKDAVSFGPRVRFVLFNYRSLP